MEDKMAKKPKPDPAKMSVLRNLPLHIKENLTKEEVEAFLYEEVWPDSLYEKLRDYVLNTDETSK